MNKTLGIWTGIIVAAISISLGAWWYIASQSINTSMPDIAPVSDASTSANSTSTVGPAVTDESGDTVKSIIASLPNASQYDSLFLSTGVANLIGSGGQFTIFVPTNAAFSSLPSSTFTKMTAAQLKRMIEYSIVDGRAIEPGAEMSGAVQAYSGDSLNFSDVNNVAMVNSSIIVSEYKGSNGVVFLINEVLLPPQASVK